MINNNKIKCSNCGEVNLLYEKNCKQCKHYLRSAVVNIDLWTTVWMLFENPKKSIKNIIMAEHKNFIIFLLLFLSFKLFLTSVTLQSAFNSYVSTSDYFLTNIILVTLIYSAIIIVMCFVLTRIYAKKEKVRFKDNLTILVYSFIPVIFSLFILAPVEYGIFGKHWLLHNPSPFLIKNTLAYILSGLEFLMLVWSIIILFIGLKIQLNSNLTSFIFVVIFLVILFTATNAIPFILI